MTDDIERIARGLTKAQREALERICKTNGGGVPVPFDRQNSPRAPFAALYDLDLIQGKSGWADKAVHTRLGLQVRDYLKGNAMQSEADKERGLVERLQNPAWHDCNHHLIMDEAADRITALEAQLATARRDALEEARPLEEWHEDHGNVVWWKFPVSEPSWIGTPLDSDWPDYHTHWTPHPPIPAIRTLMDKTDAE